MLLIMQAAFSEDTHPESGSLTFTNALQFLPKQSQEI